MTELTHISIDLETLGLRQDTVIVSLGAAAFKLAPERPNYDKIVLDGFHVKFDIHEQLNVYNRTITPSTMDWWKEQSAEARKILKPSPVDTRLDDGLIAFNVWLKKIGYDFKKSYVWSRGTYFDFPKLESAFEMAEVKCGYNGWKIRDTRTYIDILTGVDNGQYEPQGGFPKEFVKHDALHDAAMDAYRMQEIFYLNSVEQ